MKSRGWMNNDFNAGRTPYVTGGSIKGLLKKRKGKRGKL